MLFLLAGLFRGCVHRRLELRELGPLGGRELKQSAPAEEARDGLDVELEAHLVVHVLHERRRLNPMHGAVLAEQRGRRTPKPSVLGLELRVECLEAFSNEEALREEVGKALSIAAQPLRRARAGIDDPLCEP